MNIAVKKSLRILNWIKSKVENHAVILGYHRIANTSYDPYHMNVSPEHFSEQLEVIKKFGNPISLSELVKRVGENKLNDNYTVLTFDDGYADNFYRAKPLLDKYGIPATVFISTGKLNSEFWWDELERLVLASEISPEELHINLDEQSFFWKYKEKESLEPKWSLFQFLYKQMKDLPEPQIYEVLGKLKEMMHPQEIGSYKYRAMTKDEIILLNSGSLIDIGSHTVSHRNLRNTDPSQLKFEFDQSKKFLQDILNKPITGFSYPNGHVIPGSSSLLKECGYAFACISYSNYIFRNTDNYSLPRFWVPDLNGVKFEKWLSGWRN